MAAIVVTTLLARRSSGHGLGPLAFGDPGPVVHVGVTVARGLTDAASSLSVGSLAFVMLCTSPRHNRHPDDDVDVTVTTRAFAAMRWCTRWSVAWALAALASLFFAAADDAGLSLSQIGTLGSWVRLARIQSESPYWLAAVTGAVLVAVLARYSLSWRNLAAVLALAVLTLLPPLFTGHAASEAGHDLATAALALHVPAAAVWLGLLIQVAVEVARRDRVRDGLLRRYAAVAWICWVVLGGTGLVLGLVLDPHLSMRWPYGALLGTKAALFVAVGVVGGRWRRAVIRRADHAPAVRPVVRLLAVEGMLLAVAFACSAQLTSLGPPLYELPVSITQELIGYDLAGPPTLMRLLFDWRVEILFLVFALGLAAWYLVLLSRLRESATPWPRGRTAAWLTGCAVVLVSTCSGLGRYEPAMFSVHMAGHMLLATVAPILLALGGPLTLARLATRPAGRGLPDASAWIGILEDSRVIQWLTHPVVALGLLVWSPFVIYFGGIFDVGARFHWAHMLLDGYFLLAGYVFAWAVVGVDRTPRPAPSLARLGMLLAAMPFEAVFAGLVMSTHRVLGNSLASGNMYAALRLSWVHDLAADQRLGGLVALIVGEVAVTGAIVSLLVRWWRLDEPLFPASGGVPLRRPDPAQPQAVGDHEQ